MPKYHCLDTEVQLCTWVPLSRLSTLLSSSCPKTPTSAIPKRSISRLGSADSTNPFDKPAEDLLGGTAGMHEVTKLKEEFFSGHTGLDFLGYDIPFYLIHAGKDLFKVVPTTQAGATSMDAAGLDDQGSRGVSAASTNSVLSTVCSSIFVPAPDPLDPDSAIHASNLFQNGYPGVHSSPSPVLSSSKFTQRGGMPKLQELEVETEGRMHITTATPKTLEGACLSLATPSMPSRPTLAPKPVKIVVKLSDKSFMPPLFGVEDKRLDICINIFYNGEFTTSQIIEYNVWSSQRHSNSLHYCGKLIEACREIPWVINPVAQLTDESIRLHNNNNANLSPSERWNRLADLLLTEADEWGRDERGYRSPTGEYLEMLAKKTMPSDLDASPNNSRGRFGIIDVVITLGRSSFLDSASILSSPHRKLPQGRIWNGSVDLSVPMAAVGARLSSMTGMSLGMASDKLEGLSNLNLLHYEPGLKGAPKYSPTVDLSKVSAGVPVRSGEFSSNSPLLDMHGMAILALGDTPKVAMLPSNTTVASMPATSTALADPRKSHSGPPKNIPQKRYRGSEPPPTLVPKRQKLLDSLGELPVDLNASASMSTRAKRRASVSAAQTQLSTRRLESTPQGNMQPKSIFDRKKSVGQAKKSLPKTDTLEAITATEAQIDVTHTTPKKVRKSSDPKTPDSGNPRKKKPRSVKYNPKYSNRPQNLRYKNSAGEWVTPTKPKFFSPTEGQNGEASKNLSSTFQAMLTAPSEKVNQDEVAGPLARKESTIDDQPESTHDDITSSSIKSGISRNKTTRKDKLMASMTRNGAASIDQSRQIATTESGTAVPGQDVSQKKVLRIRLFQGNRRADVQSSRAGTEPTSWHAEPSVSPEYVPSPGSGKKPFTDPLPSEPCDWPLIATGQLPKPKGVTSTASSAGDPVTDSLAEPVVRSTARSRRKSSATSKPEMKGATNLVAIALRDNSMGLLQSSQTPEANRPEPNISNPQHDSHVLKLPKKVKIAAEKAAKEQGVQSILSQDIPSIHPKDKIGRRQGRCHPKEGDTPSVLTHAAHDGLQTVPQNTKSRSLEGSAPVAMAGQDRIKKTVVRDDEVEVHTQVLNSGDRNQEHNQASNQPAISVSKLKVPTRPSRMVSTSELKGLLENHPRGKAANTSFGPSFGEMENQLMTRASRKAISYSKEVKSKEESVPDNGTVEAAISSLSSLTTASATRKRAPRKRSVASEVVKKPLKPAITTAPVENFMMDDGGLQEVSDAQNSNEANTDTTGRRIRRTSLRSQKAIEVASNTVAGNTGRVNDVSRYVKIPDVHGPSRETKKPVSMRQKCKEDTPVGVTRSGKEVGISTLNVDTSMNRSATSRLIKIPISRLQTDKNVASQPSSSSATAFYETMKEIGLANKDIDKAPIDLKGQATLTPARREPSNPTLIQAVRTRLQFSKDLKEIKGSATKVQEADDKTTFIPSAATKSANLWKPNSLCEDSALTYAITENWVGLDSDPVVEQVHRLTGTEKEGLFKACGVLMGVRFVVGV